MNEQTQVSAWPTPYPCGSCKREEKKTTPATHSCRMCGGQRCDRHWDKDRKLCVDCSYEMYKNSYGGM